MFQISSTSPVFLSNWQLDNYQLQFTTTFHCCDYHSWLQFVAESPTTVHHRGYKFIARNSTTPSPLQIVNTQLHIIMAIPIVGQVQHWNWKQNNDSQVSPPTIKETSGLTAPPSKNTRFNHSHHQRNTHTHLRACTHTSIAMVTSAMPLSRDLTVNSRGVHLSIIVNTLTTLHLLPQNQVEEPSHPFQLLPLLKLRVLVTVSWGPGNVSERPMWHVNPLFSITSLEPW